MILAKLSMQVDKLKATVGSNVSSVTAQAPIAAPVKWKKPVRAAKNPAYVLEKPSIIVTLQGMAIPIKKNIM